jgi:hypothetical protein
VSLQQSKIHVFGRVVIENPLNIFIFAGFIFYCPSHDHFTQHLEMGEKITLYNFILKIFCFSRIALSKECSLEAVVERCPANMTGADFYALCSDAMLCAIKKKVTLIEQGMFL